MEPHEVQRQLVLQHMELRLLVAQVEKHGLHSPTTDADADAGLRRTTLTFCQRLAEHLDFEDDALVPVVREAIGWGPVLHERMVEEHRDQRQRVSTIGAVASDPASSTEQVASAAVAFAREILRDMTAEENNLVRANVFSNPPSSDGEGG